MKKSILFLVSTAMLISCEAEKIEPEIIDPIPEIIIPTPEVNPFVGTWNLENSFTYNGDIQIDSCSISFFENKEGSTTKKIPKEFKWYTDNDSLYIISDSFETELFDFEILETTFIDNTIVLCRKYKIKLLYNDLYKGKDRCILERTFYDRPNINSEIKETIILTK